MKKSSSRGCIKRFHGISIGSRIARSSPVMMRSLKRPDDVPRDSSSSCLKFRTSFRRLTTLEMEKKRKQNLKHNCNTLEFAFLQIELNSFNYEFLCTFKPREKIIIFIEIKIHNKFSNMVVHLCCCIVFLYCVV